MTASASVIAQAAAAGIQLRIDGDQLVCRGRRVDVEQLRPLLTAHRRELIELVTAADLPARVRARFRAACGRLAIDPTSVLGQFDRWRYCEANLREMEAWPDEIVECHCELLADEAASGVNP